jgi:hypothetical protein
MPTPVFGITVEEIKTRLPVAYAALQLGIPIGLDGYGLCPFHDDSNPSFHVWQGSTDQRWGCFPCSDSGDVLDLIQRVTGCTFREALDRADGFLRDMPADWSPPPMAVASRPEEPIGYHAEVVEAMRLGAERDWPATFVEWGVGLGPSGEHIFPHWDRSGTLTGCKVRSRAGAKWCLHPSRFPDLYGAWRPRTSTHVLLAEGETDVLTAANAAADEGLVFDVLALPHGVTGPRPSWIEFLAPWQHVYVALDADEASVPRAAQWIHALAPRGSEVSLPWGSDLRDVLADTRLTDLLYETSGMSPV